MEAYHFLQDAAREAGSGRMVTAATEEVKQSSPGMARSNMAAVTASCHSVVGMASMMAYTSRGAGSREEGFPPEGGVSMSLLDDFADFPAPMISLGLSGRFPTSTE